MDWRNTHMEDSVNYCNPGSVGKSTSAGAGRVLFAMLMGLNSVAVGEMYRWQDRTGEIHYGDAPPGRVEYERIVLPDDERDNFEHETGGTDADSEAQFERCVTALHRLVANERQQSLPGRADTMTAVAAAGLKPPGPVLAGIEAPVTNPDDYWTITHDGTWHFHWRGEVALLEDYKSRIESNCKVGPVAEEKQLAALNALIQERNCRLLRKYEVSHGAQFPRGSVVYTELRQELKHQCG